MYRLNTDTDRQGMKASHESLTYVTQHIKEHTIDL